jgi:hypothetical protein
MILKLYILTLPTKILAPSKAFDELKGAALYWAAPIFTDAVFLVFGVMLFGAMFWLTKPYPVRCAPCKARHGTDATNKAP